MQKSLGSGFFGARPARGITPFIGLAVVVALALAAVFGSMSLANPAMAAIGQSGDAELTERTIAPQEENRKLYIGADDEIDISSQISGGVTNYKSGTATARNDTAIPDAALSVDDSVRGVFVEIAGVANTLNAADGVIIDVVITLQDDSLQRFRVEVDVVAATPPTMIQDISNRELTLDAETVQFDLSDYYEAGKGTTDTSAITGYTIASSVPAQVQVGFWDTSLTPPAIAWQTAVTAVTVPITGVNANMAYLRVTPATAEVGQFSEITVTVQANSTDVADENITFYVDLVSGTSRAVVTEASFNADSSDPGKNTRYTVDFPISTEVNTLIHDLVIEFHEDYGVPASIGTASVTITTGPYSRLVDSGLPDDASTTTVDESKTRRNVDYTFTPEDVSVDGNEVFISIGDVTEDDDEGVYTVGGSGVTMEVVFRQSAGISNPTEAGGYGGIVAIAFGDAVDVDNGDEDKESLADTIPHKVSIDPEDGGLTEVVSVTGKGFKNGTTLTVFLDKKILVTWDDPSDTVSDMVPLRGGMVEQYDARLAAGMALDPPKHYGNVPMGTIPTEENARGETVAMFIDSDGYAWAPNRRLDLTDDVLCAVPKIGSDDVGKCEFTVSHPTFEGGLNYINAVDGRNNYDLTPVTFELTSSIEASPAGGSPGEIILVQVVDFDAGSSLEKVTLGRQDYCGGNNNPVSTNFTCPAMTVDSQGSGNFKITIPNWARAGVQELKVFGTGGDDGSQNITIGGPVITITPESVLANQRISLIGTGFSSNAVIGDDDLLEGPDHENDLSKISVGGEVIRKSRINDGDDVEVDSGGNWSASVDLPLSSSTTADGQRTIRVTDSGGRTGVVRVAIPAREVTITPDSGRVGTIAAVRGTGFPSKNDEGSSFNIEIVYDAGNDKETTVSAVPDASGRFEVQLRIPTTASIPSSNTVKVTFEDDDGVAVVTTVAHDVPEGIITLSNTSGGPGSTVTVNGEGFKAFVPVALVKIGTLDVTPSPKPSTDGNGMMSFAVTIPGLDVGIQTIEVNVGRTTSSTGFTVTESGINPGDIKPVAEGLEDLGDNLDVIWHFNNDTKAWTFYDGQDGSDLTHVITGETYLILVKTSVEVILNRDTRSLTCVGGNCWNQIVW